MLMTGPSKRGSSRSEGKPFLPCWTLLAQVGLPFALAMWKSSVWERGKYKRPAVCSGHIQLLLLWRGASHWESGEGMGLQDRAMLKLQACSRFQNWWICVFITCTCVPTYGCLDVQNAEETCLTACSTHARLHVLSIFVSEAFSSRGRGRISGDWNKPDRVSPGKIE